MQGVEKRLQKQTPKLKTCNSEINKYIGSLKQKQHAVTHEYSENKKAVKNSTCNRNKNFRRTGTLK